jgi:gliding motility-associated-like protein
MKLWIKILLFLIVLIKTHSVYTQNLVPNGSFEKHLQCPKNLDNLRDTVIYNWLNDHKSPDYFCECAINFSVYPFYWVDIPLNAFGFQYARTGSCYVGFFLNSTKLLCDETEIIKTNLKIKLNNNKKYYFSMYLSLSDGSTHSIDGIDVYLSNDTSLTPYNINSCTFNITPQISQRGKGVIDDTLNWVKISGEYIANGTEDHLFIGRYSALSPGGLKKNTFTPKQFPWGLPASYYYIDDVALWPSDTLPPQANAGEDKTICWGDSVQIGTHNYPDYYYQWKAGVNSLWPHQYDSGTVWVSPKYTTTYVLETTDFRFEKSYDTVTVFVELCGLKANEVFLCAGDSITLNPSPADNLHHRWVPDVFLNSSIVQSPICKPTEDIAYIHFFMDNNDSIIGQDTILIRVMDCSPARSDTTICLGDKLYLGNTNFTFYSYLWSPTDYLDNNLIANPLSNPAEKITYYVRAIDTNGITHTDSVTINLKICNLPPEIVIPNIITPNGDGINDIFRFKNEEFWHLNIQVFNRWGQLIFSGTDPERWDGTYDGKKVSDGVYFYHIAAKTDGFGMVYEYHGTVRVLRGKM